MNDEFNELLQKHQLKKTAPRISVLSVLKSREMATSQPELEEIIGKQVDRVTLYRILSTFEEKGIIHKVLGLDGTANYAFCSASCTEHEHHDEHVHFNCTVCKHIFCLPDSQIPVVNLPKGFKVNSLNISALGICDKCTLAN
ncbi:MAG: Fur family transcriptional regulator [Mucilaginibacter sp.]|uniref:Fur family transcriptional regulator n=1 Tax=Mucilaginibacter sp. TaxID=1882438 RepID=UPI0034E5F909